MSVYKSYGGLRIAYLVMVTDTGELEGSAKNGEVCNSIRIRHSIGPSDIRRDVESLASLIGTTWVMGRRALREG
jgi:hypothetical protein